MQSGILTLLFAFILPGAHVYSLVASGAGCTLAEECHSSKYSGHVSGFGASYPSYSGSSRLGSSLYGRSMDLSCGGFARSAAFSVPSACGVHGTIVANDSSSFASGYVNGFVTTCPSFSGCFHGGSSRHCCSMDVYKTYSSSHCYSQSPLPTPEEKSRQDLFNTTPLKTLKLLHKTDLRVVHLYLHFRFYHRSRAYSNVRHWHHHLHNVSFCRHRLYRPKKARYPHGHGRYMRFYCGKFLLSLLACFIVNRVLNPVLHVINFIWNYVIHPMVYCVQIVKYLMYVTAACTEAWFGFSFSTLLMIPLACMAYFNWDILIVEVGFMFTLTYVLLKRGPFNYLIITIAPLLGIGFLFKIILALLGCTHSWAMVYLFGCWWALGFAIVYRPTIVRAMIFMFFVFSACMSSLIIWHVVVQHIRYVGISGNKDIWLVIGFIWLNCIHRRAILRFAKYTGYIFEVTVIRSLIYSCLLTASFVRHPAAYGQAWGGVSLITSNFYVTQLAKLSCGFHLVSWLGYQHLWWYVWPIPPCCWFLWRRHLIFRVIWAKWYGRMSVCITFATLLFAVLIWNWDILLLAATCSLAWYRGLIDLELAANLFNRLFTIIMDAPIQDFFPESSDDENDYDTLQPQEYVIVEDRGRRWVVVLKLDNCVDRLKEICAKRLQLCAQNFCLTRNEYALRHGDLPLNVYVNSGDVLRLVIGYNPPSDTTSGDHVAIQMGNKQRLVWVSINQSVRTLKNYCSLLFGLPYERFYLTYGSSDLCKDDLPLFSYAIQNKSKIELRGCVLGGTEDNLTEKGEGQYSQNEDRAEEKSNSVSGDGDEEGDDNDSEKSHPKPKKKLEFGCFNPGELKGAVWDKFRAMNVSTQEKPANDRKKIINSRGIKRTSSKRTTSKITHSSYGACTACNEQMTHNNISSCTQCYASYHSHCVRESEGDTVLCPFCEEYVSIEHKPSKGNPNDYLETKNDTVNSGDNSNSNVCLETKNDTIKDLSESSSVRTVNSGDNSNSNDCLETKNDTIKDLSESSSVRTVNSGDNSYSTSISSNDSNVGSNNQSNGSSGSRISNNTTTPSFYEICTVCNEKMDKTVAQGHTSSCIKCYALCHSACLSESAGGTLVCLACKHYESSKSDPPKDKPDGTVKNTRKFKDKVPGIIAEQSQKHRFGIVKATPDSRIVQIVNPATLLYVFRNYWKGFQHHTDQRKGYLDQVLVGVNAELKKMKKNAKTSTEWLQMVMDGKVEKQRTKTQWKEMLKCGFIPPKELTSGCTMGSSVIQVTQPTTLTSVFRSYWRGFRSHNLQREAYLDKVLININQELKKIRYDLHISRKWLRLLVDGKVAEQYTRTEWEEMSECGFIPPGQIVTVQNASILSQPYIFGVGPPTGQRLPYQALYKQTPLIEYTDYYDNIHDFLFPDPPSVKLRLEAWDRYALFMNKFFLVCSCQGIVYDKFTMRRAGEKIWNTQFGKNLSICQKIELFQYIHADIDEFVDVTRVMKNVGTRNLVNPTPGKVDVFFSPSRTIADLEQPTKNKAPPDDLLSDFLLDLGVPSSTSTYMGSLCAELRRYTGHAKRLSSSVNQYYALQYDSLVEQRRNTKWEKKKKIQVVDDCVPLAKMTVVRMIEQLDLSKSLVDKAVRQTQNSEIVAGIVDAVTQLVTACAVGAAKIEKSLRRRRNNFYRADDSIASDYAFLCGQRPKETWRNVYDKILKPNGDLRFKTCLDVEDIRLIARELQSVVVLELSSLHDLFSDKCPLGDFQEEVLKWFPILLIHTPSDQKYIINHWELDDTQPGTGWLDLLEIFNDKKEEDLYRDEPDSTSKAREESLQAAEQQIQSGWIKRGRLPHHLRFPEIPVIAMEYITRHVTHVDSRRRSSVLRSSGVSLREIRNHLYAQIPRLKKHGMDFRTVRRLMFPPKRNTRAAEHYHAVVNAHRPYAKKDLRKLNRNGHYTFSEVKTNQQCMARFPDECVLFSSDHKDKLNVGIPAVSNFHRNLKFVPRPHNPRISDHNFPKGPRYKIDVGGYMELTHPENYVGKEGHKHKCQYREMLSPPECHDEDGGTTMDDGLDPDDVADDSPPTLPCPPCKCDPDKASTEPIARLTVRDKLGREQFKVPPSGPSYLTLRPLPFIKTGNILEINDLADILKTYYPHYKVVGICTDGGGEYNIGHKANMFGWWTLFKKLELEGFWVYSQAAGLSAYNQIERLWTKISKIFSHVTISANAPGDTASPHKAKGLTKIQRSKKLDIVFKNAIKACKERIDKNAIYAGFDILTTGLTPEEVKRFEYLTQTVEESKLCHQFATAQSMAAIQKAKALIPILEDSYCMMKHMDRRSNSLYFNLCADPSCKLPQCVRKVKHAKKWCRWFLNDMDGLMYTVTPNDQRPGHYYNFCEMEELRELGKWKRDATDSWLPSLEEQFSNKEHPLFPGRCVHPPGCRYVYNSKADKKHHESIFHPEELAIRAAKLRVEKEEKKGKQYDYTKFTCNQCSVNFYSETILKRHLKEFGHTKQKKERTQGKSFDKMENCELPPDADLIERVTPNTGTSQFAADDPRNPHYCLFDTEIEYLLKASVATIRPEVDVVCTASVHTSSEDVLFEQMQNACSSVQSGDKGSVLFSANTGYQHWVAMQIRKSNQTSNQKSTQKSNQKSTTKSKQGLEIWYADPKGTAAKVRTVMSRVVARLQNKGYQLTVVDKELNMQAVYDDSSCGLLVVFILCLWARNRSVPSVTDKNEFARLHRIVLADELLNMKNRPKGPDRTIELTATDQESAREQRPRFSSMESVSSEEEINEPVQTSSRLSNNEAVKLSNNKAGLLSRKKHMSRIELTASGTGVVNDNSEKKLVREQPSVAKPGSDEDIDETALTQFGPAEVVQTCSKAKPAEKSDDSAGENGTSKLTYYDPLPWLEDGDYIIFETDPALTFWCGQVLDCHTLGTPCGRLVEVRHLVHHPVSLSLNEGSQLYPALHNLKKNVAVADRRKDRSKRSVHVKSTGEVPRESIRRIVNLANMKLREGVIAKIIQELADSEWRKNNWSNFLGDNLFYPTAFDTTNWNLVCITRNHCGLIWRDDAIGTQSIVMPGCVVFIDACSLAVRNGLLPKCHHVAENIIFLWVKDEQTLRVWPLRYDNISNMLRTSITNKKIQNKAIQNAMGPFFSSTTHVDLSRSCESVNTNLATTLPEGAYLVDVDPLYTDLYRSWKIDQIKVRANGANLPVRPYETEQISQKKPSDSVAAETQEKHSEVEPEVQRKLPRIKAKSVADVEPEAQRKSAIQHQSQKRLNKHNPNKPSSLGVQRSKGKAKRKSPHTKAKPVVEVQNEFPNKLDEYELSVAAHRLHNKKKAAIMFPDAKSPFENQSQKRRLKKQRLKKRKPNEPSSLGVRKSKRQRGLGINQEASQKKEFIPKKLFPKTLGGSESTQGDLPRKQSLINVLFPKISSGSTSTQGHLDRKESLTNVLFPQDGVIIGAKPNAHFCHTEGCTFNHCGVCGGDGPSAECSACSRPCHDVTCSSVLSTGRFCSLCQYKSHMRKKKCKNTLCA